MHGAARPPINWLLDDLPSREDRRVEFIHAGVGAQTWLSELAWCEARTGYPLIDAAMRQLHQTGYMHNRLRMVVASFLTKDLGIDWRRVSVISPRNRGFASSILSPSHKNSTHKVALSAATCLSSYVCRMRASTFPPR